VSRAAWGWRVSGDIYDWERCDHRFIGEPGCPTCDPDAGRVMIRSLRLDNRDLRVQRDALAEALRGVLEEVDDANGWTRDSLRPGGHAYDAARAALVGVKP
jgi:hypothetical protein